MPKQQSLLVVEDDPAQQQILKLLLGQMPYSIDIVSDADDALLAFEKTGQQVVLCDINLPGVLSGVDVLKGLMGAYNPPIVVMLTAISDIEKVIETMRLGAFDYVLKSAPPAEIVAAVERAFRRAEVETARRAAEYERTARLDAQYVTARIKSNLVQKQKNKFTKELFTNIYTSFAQGRGIGSLTTLISILSSSVEKVDGGKYLLPAEIMDMMFDNQSAVTNMIQVFADLQALVSQEHKLLDATLGEFHHNLRDIMTELNPLSVLRGHAIYLSDLPARYSTVRLKLNWEFLRKSIRELLLNAMKFSPNETPITILVEYLYSRVLVTVINVPLQGDAGDPVGIPDEYQKVIFDPFFRISKVVHEQYPTLDYGLGLTYAEKVMQMHNGNIICTELADYTAEHLGARNLIAFEIELPIAQ